VSLNDGSKSIPSLTYFCRVEFIAFIQPVIQVATDTAYRILGGIDAVGQKLKRSRVYSCKLAKVELLDKRLRPSNDIFAGVVVSSASLYI